MPETSFLERLFSLQGKAALVTGASGGLGRAISVALAAAGARVGIHGVTPDRLEGTRRSVEDAGGTGVKLPAALEDVESCNQLIATAQRVLGGVDILVNCAGMNRRKPIESVTPEDFERVIGLNLRSAFFLSQAAQRRMREHGGGKIIHIGSMTSTLGLANLSVYGMSKSALAQVTKTMAVEWARDNIQVNCIAPGFMRTPLTEDYYWKDPHRSRWLLERIPARRGGEPEDLAGIVVWLASPASSYVTGQVIAVDGGFTAGGSWDKQEE